MLLNLLEQLKGVSVKINPNRVTTLIQTDKDRTNQKLVWNSEEDKELLQLVLPLSKLISAKVSGTIVQRLLKRQEVVFCVEQERLFIKGQSADTWSRPLQGVPDLLIVVRKKESTSTTAASLTEDSRRVLKLFANYGELLQPEKLTPLSRTEFLIKYSISEEALENWCSFCGLDSDLSYFTLEQVSQLDHYQTLSNSGVAAYVLFELFNG